MKQKSIDEFCRVGASVLAICVSSASFAAQDDFAGLEEVVVTAQKREATLQDTPVAVTAVTGNNLKDRGIATIQDLELSVPSLNTGNSVSSSSQSFSIRGLGTSSFNAGLEPSVGVFIDGVYRSRAASAINDFLAVERVEVLRGPQSTVFGKNTPAGVISIITKKPEREFGFDIEQTFGNYDSQITRGTVTGPIGELAAFRLSGNYNNSDGYIDNIQPGRDAQNNRDRYSVRGQLLIEPNDDLSIRIIADGASITEDCCAAPQFFNDPVNAFATQFTGGTIFTGDIYDREVNIDGLVETDQEQSGISVQVDWQGANVTFTSLSAFRDFEETNDIDADFNNQNSSGRRLGNTQRQVITQEFRIQSVGDNTVDWMLGYYYYDSDQETTASTLYGPDLRTFADLASSRGAILDGVTPSPLAILEATLSLPANTFLQPGQGLLGANFDLGTTSHSVFGKVDWHVNDRLTLSVGGRWSTEDKEIDASININDPLSQVVFAGPLAAFAGLSAFQFNIDPGPFSEDRSESENTGALIASYQVTEDVSVYASANRGYKAGGFNVSPGAVATGLEFGKEIADSFELGGKARFWDNRAQLNVALFHQRLRDFQTNAFNGTTFTLVNAGKIEIDGLEVESVFAPVENLTIALAATYLDPEYVSFVGGPSTASDKAQVPRITTRDLSGEQLAGVPDWTVSSSVSYLQNIGPVDAFFSVAARYRGSRNVTSNPLESLGDQSGYTVVNASVGFSDLDGLWKVTFWSNNLFDEEYTDNIFPSVGANGSFNGIPGDPRTYGVALRVQY